MKIFVLALGFFLIISTADASSLSDADRKWITNALASFTVVSQCNGYDHTENGLRRHADATGVNYDIISPAFTASFPPFTDHDQNQILEVSQFVATSEETLQKTLTEDRPAFCMRWGALLTSERVLQRVKR